MTFCFNPAVHARRVKSEGAKGLLVRGPDRDEFQGWVLLNVLMSHGIADGQLPTALGPASGKNLLAVFGLHSGSKTMFIDPFSVSGLKSSLHGLGPAFTFKGR